MKALSIHAPYVYEIINGYKKEEYRTWKPKELGRILICSSSKKYTNYVSGYALCTVDVIGINEYPHQGTNGRMLYGWKLKNVEYVKPFPVKGKLHLFDVDDKLIKPLGKSVGLKEFIKQYYQPLRS